MKKEIRLSLRGLLNRGNGSYPSGRLWPCLDFSVGFVRTPPDERLDERPVEFCAAGDEGTEAQPLDLRYLPNSHNWPQCPLSAGETGQKRSSRPESYGRKGITGYGKKMVKSVGSLIDRQYPNHRVTFATVTMPSLPSQLRRQLAQEWPRLVNRLMQWLRRRLERADMPQIVVSVTEVQPKRLTETGEGYLHLHLLWLNRPAKSGHWSVDVGEMKAWVQGFLVDRGIWCKDAHVNIDVRRVEGEKARYLAKYCSKGSDVIAEFASDNGWPSVPGQWWNMSSKARHWVKENLVEGKAAGEVLDALINASFDYEEFCHFNYLYHVDIEVGGRLVNVGWRGSLKYEDYLHLVQCISDLDGD